MKGPLYSCLLIVRLPSRSKTLKWHLETIYMYSESGGRLFLPQPPPFQSTALTTNIREEEWKTNQEAQPYSKGETKPLVMFPLRWQVSNQRKHNIVIVSVLYPPLGFSFSTRQMTAAAYELRARSGSWLLLALLCHSTTDYWRLIRYQQLKHVFLFTHYGQ